MRNFFFGAATLFVSTFAFAQPVLPLRSQGPLPVFFHCPSHVRVDADIAQRNASGDPVSQQEEDFLREMSYFSQQRMFSGLVLFNDSLSNYVAKVAAVVLRDDTATLNQLHFYVYESPDPNAYTSATGAVLITAGMLAQLDNEAQLAFILSHEITHFRRQHMLKGYLNREELKAKNGNGQSFSWVSSYYSYNQEQELEADRLGFELFKKSPYSVQQALRSFDVLEYADLPFDDVQFDTLFFNRDYMKIPPGYFLKTVDPIYSDDNYEDRNSTHPNVRKRRMALMTAVDSVKNDTKTLYVVSEQEFHRVRELARYEICRLYLIDRDYPDAIYAAYMLLQHHPGDRYLEKIIGWALYDYTAYNQNQGGNFLLSQFNMWNATGDYGGRYARLTMNSYYHLPDYKNFPGQQQQIYHLFSKLDPDELTVLALSYNWNLYKENPADSLQSQLCDSLFSMLVNKQNLHRSYFSTVSPDEARKQLALDSIQRVQQTGDTGDSKYSRLDKFKLSSGKERFVKFAFVELLKDSNFTKRFDYYTLHRSSLVYDAQTDWHYANGKPRKKHDDDDNNAYGYGINHIIVVGPDYGFYKQDARNDDPKQNYTASENGQLTLGKIISDEAKKAGVNCTMLNPLTMDSLSTDSFADLSVLNEWFFERFAHGNNPYVKTLNNQSQVDSIAGQYGTRYVMFTSVDVSQYKKIQRPVLFGLSCILVVPAVRLFIPHEQMEYNVAILDLKTGQVVATDHTTFKKGKEPKNTSAYYKKLFEKMLRAKKPSRTLSEDEIEQQRGM